MEVNLLKYYPKSSRPIEERGKLIKEEHRAIARKFDFEYFDGDRLTGYGGYKYNPKFWTDTVKYISEYYKCSLDEANEYITLLGKKGVNDIFTKMGVEDKEKKSLTKKIING